MTEQEVSAFLNEMHMTHNISITFTPIGEKVADATTNNATTSLTEERVIELIKEHTQVQSDAIEEAVKSAIEDFDFSDIVDDCCNNRDITYDVEQALDSLSGSQLHELARSLRRDQGMLTEDDISPSDVMLKSEHLNEDDVMTRGDMSDAIADDLKRDWFKMMVNDLVKDTVEKTIKELFAKAFDSKANSTPAAPFDNETPNIQ
jgi:hypothetical protein